MKFNNKIPLVKGVGFSSDFHNINKLGLGKAYASDNSTHIDGEICILLELKLLGMYSAIGLKYHWV